MAKGQGTESTKEIQKPGHGDAKAGHADDAKKGEYKKAEVPASKLKGHSPLPGGCHAWGCKAQAHRFNFCDEHYDHFKFGLIKKTGEPVSDYEKKIEHYMAHKKRTGVQKVA
jgi:hypothetical protein